MAAQIESKSEVLKLAPEYLNEADVHLNSALSTLSGYQNSLKSIGMMNRNNKYEYNCNYLQELLKENKNSIAQISDKISSTVTIIENFENGTITATEATTQFDELVAQSNIVATASQTGAQVGTNEGNDGFWEWLGNAVLWLADLGASLVATLIDAFASLLVGLVSLVDKIIDAAIMLGGTVATGFSLLLNLFGANFDIAAIQDHTESLIMSFSLSDMTRDAIYSTSFMQNVTEYSFLNDTARGLFETAGEWVGIAAICVATAGLGAPAATVTTVGTGVGFAKGFGGGAELAFENGMGFNWALGLGTAMGVVDAYMGYCTGNTANVFVSNTPKLFHLGGEQLALESGNGLTTLTSQAAAQGISGLPAIYDPAFAATMELLPPLAAAGAVAIPSIFAYGSGFLLTTAVDTAMEAGAKALMTNFGTSSKANTGRPGNGFQGDRPNGSIGGGRPSKDDDDDNQNNEENNNEENPIINNNPSGGDNYPSGGGGGTTGDPGYNDPTATPDNPTTEEPVTTDNPTEEPKDDPKEEPKDEPTEEPKDEPNEEPTDPTEPEEPTDPTEPEEPEEPSVVVEPGDENSPEINFVNVGPDSIPIGQDQVVDGGFGSVVADGGGTPQFNIPDPVEPVTPAAEPEYIWESMTPTVENPALESGIVDNLEVSQGPVTEELIGTSDMVDSLDNVNITPPEVTAPEVDSTFTANSTTDSILGMGGIAAGTALTGVYANSKINNSKEEKKDEKEKSKDAEKEGFNQQ